MIQQFLGALLAMSVAGVFFVIVWIQRQNIAALVLQATKLGRDLTTARDERDQVQRRVAMMVTICQSRASREKAILALLTQPDIRKAVAAHLRDQQEVVGFLLEMEKPEKAAALQADLESILTALEQAGITPESLEIPAGAS